MEDIFVPYLEGDRYIKVEHKWLSDSFATILAPFQQFATNHAKIYKKGKPGSSTSPTDALYYGIVSAVGSGSSVMTYGDESLLVNLNTVLKMLKHHIASIERCKELCHPTIL